MKPARIAGSLLLLLSLRVQAAPDVAPYRPLYPAMYLDVSLELDPRDEAFDEQGDRRGSALPSLENQSKLPARQLESRFAWYFPLFEQEQLPFFSGRLHTARVTLRYLDVDARGAVADLARENPPLTQPGAGVGDTTLEFGSFLSGSSGWRGDGASRVSTLLLLGLTVPTGQYDHDAPVNPGSNHLSTHVKLGAHAQAWRGGLFDAGLALRLHGRDEEPQFGGLSPAKFGREIEWDLQVAQRLRAGLYGSLAFSGRDSGANTYEDPRVTGLDDNALPLADLVAVPGKYRDQGADVIAAALGLRWFLGQNLAAGLHYEHPLAGHSGEFDLDLARRLPAGCNLDSPTCALIPSGSTHVDGLGSARSYASDRFGLTLTYQFGQGDPYACPGCSD